MGSSISSISAEVILKSQNDRTIVSDEKPLTAANIEDYRLPRQSVKDAVKHLRKLGFDTFPSDFSVTIRGSKSLFEEVFQVKLTVSQDDVSQGIRVHSDKQLTIPPVLSDIVELVVFPPKPQFFR
jgi:hypothetical protein